MQSVKYPIPNIVCRLSGVKTTIGLDIVTNKNYIGFVRFVLDKNQFDTFKFHLLPFKFEIYGSQYCKEINNLHDIEEIKTLATSSQENNIYVKIQICSLQQCFDIVDSLSTAKKESLSMLYYVCDCGHDIGIESYYGQCPICGKDSPLKRKFHKLCPVCKCKTLVDKYGNGECVNCGWLMSKMSAQYHSRIIYPNLISLKKAKQLYQEGKSLRPALNDFLDGLYFYSEMEFWYKGLNCCLFLTDNSQGKIEFGWNSENVYFFLDKEDFIKNAKIGDEFVRDIWDKVENPKYM